MKKLAIGLCLLVGLICRSDAQLNGEYEYDIGYEFEEGIYCLKNGAEYYLHFSFADPDMIFLLGAQCRHDPKTGLFSINGNTDFEQNNGQIWPNNFNTSLPFTDRFSLSSAPTTISGKTYTNKRSGKPVFDISGIIQLIGQYDVGGESEEILVAIKKGLLSFRGKGLDAENAYDSLGSAVMVGGSAPLANKTTKKFGRQIPLNGFDWGKRLIWGGGGNVDSIYLYLDLSTTGGKILGNGEVYYQSIVSPDSPFENSYYPPLDDESKLWKYSVKGTSKNGIATLNLTGLGVINGLKATIYIDEDTEEIIPNGKNSITLYGQTIKY
jgi:hypothetical protein